MKKVYEQPVAETIKLKLFGSLMDDTGLGAASYMDTTEEWGGRRNSFFGEEEEEDNDMYSNWVSPKQTKE